MSSRARSQSHSKSHSNPKTPSPDIPSSAYWQYMIEADKKPTKQLHMLLTAIAKYITEHLTPLNEKKLSPNKLASFYKAVGGNYDALFIDVPYPSISYIYQSIGCQHTLQPTANDFAEPSIPALTVRGFVRWETIETLLQPEEHVPYLQYAVRNFALRHPETGEPYPNDLPAHVFPLVADEEIERWHTDCAKRLKTRAAADDDPRSRPDLPPRPDIRHAFSHVPRHEVPQKKPYSSHDGTDYFASRSTYRESPRDIPHSRPPQSRSAGTKVSSSAPSDSSSESKAKARRKSVPENHHYPASPLSSRFGRTPPPMPESRATPEQESRRQYSHSRNTRNDITVSSSSSSSDESSESDMSPVSHKRPVRGTDSVHPDKRTYDATDGIRRGPSISSPRVRAATSNKDDHARLSPTDHRARFQYAEHNLSRSGSRASAKGVENSKWRNSPPKASSSLRSSRDNVLDDIDTRYRHERPKLSQMRSGSHDGRSYGSGSLLADGRKDRLERFRDRDIHTDHSMREDRDDNDVSAGKLREKEKPKKRRWW